MSKLKQIWEKLSRNGLRDDEGVFGHREVILLNKILIVSPIIIALIIPVELYVNGVELLPLELFFILLMLLPFFLQRYRLFYLARLISFLAGNGFIIVAGTLVGKGVNNNIAFIPLMLFGLLLFKTTRDRVIVFIHSIGFYFLLKYLQNQIEPSYIISEESKATFTIIFYLMSLLLTFVLGYYFVNINNDYEKLIVAQKEGLASKNKEITDSINYAKRIQQAKLPQKEEIYAVLKQCFILFKPKDIVSGDFYFFHKTDSCTLIAAADCTGHGVPGALMSMVGSEQLNEAVQRTTDTSEILKFINQGIKTSLRQTNADESSRDGMDIALCSFNKEQTILKYAAANRPIWIIRNGQNIIEEIKATKKAIAGFTENDTHFETHEIQLNKGDTIYIFTDGYADQFGAENGKKLTTKKMKELLLLIQNKSMSEQEEFLNNFIENWKAQTEQVDDILIIGIRF